MSQQEYLREQYMKQIDVAVARIEGTDYSEKTTQVGRDDLRDLLVTIGKGVSWLLWKSSP